MYDLHKTPEFDEWFEEQPWKAKLQIDARLFRIQVYGHFGLCKQVGDHICELKWTNGRRVYYAYVAEYDLLLLLGGNKNGQSKDIKQAENILRTYTEAED